MPSNRSNPLCILYTKRAQALFVKNFDSVAAGGGENSLAYKMLKPARNDLARRAHIFCYLVVRQMHGVGAALCRLVKKKYRKALVHTHKEHLLHSPDNVGKARERTFKRKYLRLGHASCDILKGTAANDNALAVLLCVNRHVKGYTAKNAGGGEYADVARKKAVKGDLLAVLGQKIYAQGAAFYKNYAGTLVSVVYVLALLKPYRLRSGKKRLFLPFGKKIEKGEGIFEKLF